MGSLKAIITAGVLGTIFTGGFICPVQAVDVAALPTFALTGPSLESGGRKWDGEYLRVSSGFSVTSFRHGPTVAGPIIGIEAGKLWREGNFVWGLNAAGSYEPATARWKTPAFGVFDSYNRDFSGAIRVKAGILATENLLFYTSVGAIAGHENWKSTPFGGFSGSNFSRDDIRVRPDIRAGVEWAVTPNITLGLELGVAPQIR